MKHYIEITLIPNPDINLFSLWSKVYQQLHLGLVEIQDDQGRVAIGIAFPEYVIGEKFSMLGAKCRLFAMDEATLTRFDDSKWLARLSDYVHCTSIRAVPEHKIKGYATYRRLQPKTNPERLARRFINRWDKHHGGQAVPDFDSLFTQAVELSVKGQENEEAKKWLRYCEMPRSTVQAPFIRLKSLSSGHDFCLWIQKNLKTEATAGGFNRYGLSATATVPEFD